MPQATIYPSYAKPKQMPPPYNLSFPNNINYAYVIQPPQTLGKDFGAAQIQPQMVMQPLQIQMQPSQMETQSSLIGMQSSQMVMYPSQMGIQPLQILIPHPSMDAHIMSYSAFPAFIQCTHHHLYDKYNKPILWILVYDKKYTLITKTLLIMTKR